MLLGFLLFIEDVVDGSCEALIPTIQLQDKSYASLSSTSILKERNLDITVEEEVEIQKKLSQAKSEIQTLIIEGQRLRVANQQLQKDIDLHSERYAIKYLYIPILVRIMFVLLCEKQVTKYFITISFSVNLPPMEFNLTVILKHNHLTLVPQQRESVPSSQVLNRSLR